MRKTGHLIAAVLAGALAPLAADAQAASRTADWCGWIDNPTPGNWWLTDSTGEYVISVQGADISNNWFGVDVPEFREWVRTNGSYGFGCGCIRGSLSGSTGTVAWIESVRALPLSRCHGDPALPRR